MFTASSMETTSALIENPGGISSDLFLVNITDLNSSDYKKTISFQF